jgi:hypothetical protein
MFASCPAGPCSGDPAQSASIWILEVSRGLTVTVGAADALLSAQAVLYEVIPATHPGMHIASLDTEKCTILLICSLNPAP